MQKKIFYTLILCFILNGLMYLYFIATSPDTRHWMLLPNFLMSNILIYMAVSSFFKSKYKYFSVKFIVYIFSFYFFTVVPLLTVKWDYYIPNVIQPNDWRTWIGILSLVNLIGILIFIFTQKLNIFNIEFRTWKINYKKFYKLSFITLVVSFLAQTYYYVSVGGISAFINLYSDRYSNDAFNDAGFIFTLTESFPIVLGLTIIVYMKKNNYEPKWIWLTLLLFIIFVVRMYFGGLRGSRSNTIWAIFWIVSLIHLWIRPINLRIIGLGTLLLILFMNVYSLYKIHGTDFYKVFVESDERIEVLNDNSNGMETVLLQDFGRTDTQAYILYKNLTKSDTVKAYGETYLGTATLLIPDSFDIFEFNRKMKFGTDILYGSGAYESGLSSSKVYGLYGEAVLNFGIILGLLSFAVWGLVVNYINTLQHKMDRQDSRMMVIPLLLIVSILMLINDSDNILFFMIKNGLIPFVIIILSRRSN